MLSVLADIIQYKKGVDWMHPDYKYLEDIEYELDNERCDLIMEEALLKDTATEAEKLRIEKRIEEIEQEMSCRTMGDFSSASWVEV